MTAAGSKIFQSFLGAAAGSATCTELEDEDDDKDGATAGEDPDADDGRLPASVGEIAEALSCTSGTDPEAAETPCRDSVSRFSRFRSVRISAAC